MRSSHAYKKFQLYASMRRISGEYCRFVRRSLGAGPAGGGGGGPGGGGGGLSRARPRGRGERARASQRRETLGRDPARHQPEARARARSMAGRPRRLDPAAPGSGTSGEGYFKISYCVQSYHHLDVITDSSAAAQAVAIDLRRQERDPVKLGHGTPRPNLGAAMRREPNPLLNAGPAPRHHSPQEHHGCRSRWRCLVCVSQEGG